MVEPPSARRTRKAFSTDFCIDDPVRREVRADQLHRRRAGRLRRAQPIGMHGRDRRGAGQNETERLGDAGHGGGRAHHGAGAGGHRELAFDLRDFLVVDLAGAIARPEASAIGAGTEPLAAVTARSSSGRPPASPPAAPADTAPISCAGTVLSQPPISTTASIGCARIISSVSIDIRLRYFRLVGLRKTSPSEIGRKLDRQCAGREHAALDRVQQVREMTVAIVEARRRVGDADHGLCQHRAANSPWTARRSGADRARSHGRRNW